MSDYIPLCHSGITGLPLDHDAEGYLVAPTGRQSTAMCHEHAQAVIDEYAAKLGEHWTFKPNERRMLWRGIPHDQPELFSNTKEEEHTQ